MLATILKSPRATATTLAIINAYANLRELASTLKKASEETDDDKRKSLTSKTGHALSNLLSNDLKVTEEEYSVEINLMAIKLTKKVKRSKT